VPVVCPAANVPVMKPLAPGAMPPRSDMPNAPLAVPVPFMATRNPAALPAAIDPVATAA